MACPSTTWYRSRRPTRCLRSRERGCRTLALLARDKASTLCEMQLYYITDRRALPGDERARRRRLLDKIIEAARAGVDYIQIREKDLTAAELEALGREAVCAVRQANPETRLLLNSRMDVALAIEADGVHLRADDLSPAEVAAIRSGAATFGHRIPAPLLAAGSSHSGGEVRRAG